MKVSLYMAVSIDGYVATSTEDSTWVSNNDGPAFQRFIRSNDVIVMGRRTYEKGIEEGVYPFNGAINIVVTSNKKLTDRKPNGRELFINKKPRELIKYFDEKEFRRIGIIGGGKFNGSMLRENLIDEIIIDVHPLILGDGVKIFEDFVGPVKLEKIEVTEAHELVWIKYRVIKGS